MRVCLPLLMLTILLEAVMPMVTVAQEDSSRSAGHSTSTAPLQSQTDRTANISADSMSVQPVRLAIIGGTVLGAMTAIQLYQTSGWWKANRGPFHFREDLTYAVNVDKVGHFYGASVLTFTMSKALRWANVSEEQSLLYGGGLSLLFQTFVEVQDGFSKAYGFDRVDFAADVAGAAFPIARHHLPFLKNFDVKMSYVPSRNINGPGALPGQKFIMMDDYEGQTFWLSIKVNNLLPRSMEPWWPDVLALALGYGGREVVSSHPYPVILLGLDIDMTRLIPDDTPFLKTLGESLNFIRFPMPAVQISPRAIWYGFYF